MNLTETRAWLRGFDAIVVNSSGGKDSQTALHRVAVIADEAGVLDRVTVLHCDLGHVEWPGALTLAATQSAYYGVPFQVRRREHGGLLDLVLRRRLWPSANARYCTSSLKRDVARRFYTETARQAAVTGRPARLLSVMGIRAAESRARAARPAVFLDRASSSGRREVTVWHPIHELSTAQVWAAINASGAPHHPVYRHVSRLSCSLCPLAARADLIAAARLRPALAAQYAAVEREIGHRFRADLSMAEIIRAAARSGPAHTSAVLRLRAATAVTCA
jgi:3'-phosphoadenosine 5'-phosphosulfate sulfotransferase (PAPS reductase)/FAD synthetase